jgi:hypothetical protein
MRGTVEAYGDLLERARADPNVVGVLVLGPAASEKFVTDRSDIDCYMITRTADGSWSTPHGSSVEVWSMTLEAFRRHALEGEPDAWNRPTFLRTRIDLDRLDGEIDRIVERKRSLADDEAQRLATAALDDYTNSLYRSLRNLEAGRSLEGRLDAIESIGPLLTTVFALEGRVRPFNKWLIAELEDRPVSMAELLEFVEGIARDADPSVQRRAFRAVEAAARAAGLGAVVDGWEPDVLWLRGGDPPRT